MPAKKQRVEFDNPEWRLENLYSIVNKQGEKVPFARNGIQRMLAGVDSRYRMILKSRQVGISTAELIRMLDHVIFNDNVTACIMAHENDAIEKLFRIVRRAYEFMPPAFKPDLDRGGGSKFEMFFPSVNSRIYCDLQSRGDTIHWLHISERAFIKDPMRVKATTEAVPMTTGIITQESTANGMGNEFYTEWVDPESIYTKCFYPWFMHEEYKINDHELTTKLLTEDEKDFIRRAKIMHNWQISLAQIAYRRFKQRSLREAFKQEYPEDDISCFLTSGSSPFNLEVIKPLYDAAVKREPIEIIDGIKIYEKMDNGENYVIGADTAEGVEGDWSVGHVFKVSNRQQVATYRGRIKPSEFAQKLVRMSDLYSKRWPILIGVERNNHGHAVLLALDEILDYVNIYKYHPEKFGWLTDKVTRPVMLDTLIEGVENSTIQLIDKQTLAECLTLVNNNGKIEAETGNHDDTVIAAAIAVQMCIEESKLGIYSDVANKIKL